MLMISFVDPQYSFFCFDIDVEKFIWAIMKNDSGMINHVITMLNHMSNLI